MFERYQDSKSKFVDIPVPDERDKLCISEDGQVFSQSHGFIQTSRDEDGFKTVYLDLWNGLKSYRVGLLTLVAYGKLRLQPQYFDMVETFHLDGDKDNHHPANIGYRYKAPIECEQHPEFFYIPCYNNYVIDRRGNIKAWRTGVFLTQHTSRASARALHRRRKQGYKFVSAVSDTGHKNARVHRLLALTFIPYPDNVDELTVNHLDGDPGNNCIENLEWTTFRGNLIHAMTTNLMRRDAKPATIAFERGYAINVITGAQLEFTTFQQVSKLTGIAHTTVRDRIAEKSQALCQGGWMFKDDPSTPWRVVKDPWKELSANTAGMKIRSMNVFTGEVREHENARSAQRELGFDSAGSMVKRYINKGFKTPLFGYVFRMEYDTTPWPEFNERQLAVFRDSPMDPRTRGVVARKPDGSEMFFTNIKRAAEHFKELQTYKGAVIDAVRSGRVVDGYTLYYFNSLTGETEGVKPRVQASQSLAT